MHQRPLGRTGVSVCKLCLGAMMFGSWGNPDHDESIRIIHAALDAGINFVDTADVYGAGESEEIVGKALAGGRRDNVVLATKFFSPMGEDANRRGRSRRWIIQAVEDSLRRLNTDWIDLYQVHRPRPGHRHRRDAVGAHRPRPPGQGPLHRPLHVPGQPDRRGAVDRSGPPPAALRHRAARLLDPRARHRSRRPAHLPAPRHGRDVLQPAHRRLALRALAQGLRATDPRRARAACPSASTSPSPPTSASSTPSSAHATGRRHRHHAHPTRDRLRAQPPGDHRGDHRPAHHGAVRRPSRRRRCHARSGGAGPHRRDRPARHDRQPRRQLLRQPRTGTGRPPTLRDELEVH